MRAVSWALLVGWVAVAACGCGSDEDEGAAGDDAVERRRGNVGFRIEREPFTLSILDGSGRVVLATSPGADGAYGAPGATVDEPYLQPRGLPGWDGYIANEAPWSHAHDVEVQAGDSDATITWEADGAPARLRVTLEDAAVVLALDVGAPSDGREPANKTSLSFGLRPDEHFFGLGERFATVDHRGFSLYAWAEEGGLGRGEDAPVTPTTPVPNGPSMTYFPVPFALSTEGYGISLGTTYRSEMHLGSERPDAWRLAVNAASFQAKVYVHDDPSATLRDYARDVGRPMTPAPWVFGVRRRVNRGAEVDGVDEATRMREQKLPITGIDDALHMLPSNSHVGHEADLAAWTKRLHALGYKVHAYNNPYVAKDVDAIADEWKHGVERGLFVKGPDGQPTLTEFISGRLLTLATIDLTNPEAVAWFQSLLQRTLDLGYDGWMHDFGEYVPRDAVLFDGRRGDEVHDEFPLLSARAAHDLMERERPGDYLFFVRSGYAGQQAWAPAVWGGDAEATFDETQGLPSAVRGGLNLSMSGVAYWGSDMTGFKCITDAPNDREVFYRWVQLGAVSPIMMEQDACSNPLQKKTKWKLWNDQATVDHYRKWALLHTRLQPYFVALAARAAEDGTPLTVHPWLRFPHEPEAWKVDDAFFLGPALYAAPVVRRGLVEKTTWLPPGRYVDLDDGAVYEGGRTVTIPAPLEKLPLLLVDGGIVPMLDPSIDTLAPATDPGVVTPESVSDRLDVLVAIGAGGHASFVLADGTELIASRTPGSGASDALTEVDASQLADCSLCVAESQRGDVRRVQMNGEAGRDGSLRRGDLEVAVHGPGASRRIRWDVQLLP